MKIGRLVPDFILQQYAAGRRAGCFEAATLSVDISGGLAATNDPRAGAFLAGTWQQLTAQMGVFLTPAARHRCLEHVPWRRELRDAAQLLAPAGPARD